MKGHLLTGYEFGQPWRLKSQSVSVVVPIIRHNTQARQYVLLQEIKDKVKINDPGAINRSVIQNPTDETIFIRGGTLVKGETQERGVTVGTVVLPRTTHNIPVQCVHASKPIRQRAGLSVMAHIAPRHVESSFLARSDQSATWSAVGHDVHVLYSLSPTERGGFGAGEADDRTETISDDLVGVLEQTSRFKDEIEHALEKIPADLENQVGMAILNVQGVVGLEAFDHPDSWQAFSKSIVRNYADLLTEEGSDFLEVKMDKVIPAVESFMQKLDHAEGKVVAEVHGSKTYALDSDVVVGEYTELNSRVIHLIVRKRERESSQTRHYGLAMSSLMPSLRQGPPTEDERERTFTAASIARDSRQYESYFEGKGALNLLTSLKEPKTWKDLESNLDLSTRTLSKRVDEAKSLDLIAQKPRPSNGRHTYRLSEKGKKVLRWAKSYLK